MVLQSAKSSVKGAGETVQSVATGGESDKTTVYKWVDEYGVTQFGSHPPNGVDATTMVVNNKANVVARRKPVPTVEEQQAAQQGPKLGPDGEPLPGIAGMNLPVAVDPAVLSEFLQSMQQQQ